MRIFLIWPDASPETINLVSGLRSSGYEIIYWLGLKGDEGKLPDIIVHNHWDAWLGIPPPELKDAEFDPPGEELINKMHRVESIILTMMNKHFEGMCVSERKALYYKLLSYWYGTLNKFKPEAVIFSQPPHPIHNYLIFELTQLLKIKTIIFGHTLVAGRTIWEDSFWEGSRILLEKIAANKDKKFTIKDLSEDLQRYLEFCFDDTAPANVKNFMKRFSLKNKVILKIKTIAKSIRNLTIFKRVYLFLYKLLKSNVQKEYHYYSSAALDLSKEFIYAPLCFQPECTTSPMGGIFVDQILMIETLAAALPKGWVIYVKEHPAQWASYGLNYTDYRYPGYYKRISRIKNVQLIPVKTNSFSLIKNSKAVASVSGSAAWEAILRNKPALVFGYPWYKDGPGILKINDTESCRLAIKKIIDGYKPNQEMILNYLKCLDQASIHGFIDKRTQGNLKITKQDCINNMLTVINKELKNS